MFTYYIDDDVNRKAIRQAREERGVTVITSEEVDMGASADEDHAAYAIENGYVLVTANIQDFRPLYGTYDDHPGIVFVTFKRIKNDTYIAEMLELFQTVFSTEEMRNRMEWI